MPAVVHRRRRFIIGVGARNLRRDAESKADCAGGARLRAVPPVAGERGEGRAESQTGELFERWDVRTERSEIGDRASAETRRRSQRVAGTGRASADVSFFLTADWADAWMQAIAGTLKPDILIFRCGPEVVGACCRGHGVGGPIPLTRSTSTCQARTMGRHDHRVRAMCCARRMAEAVRPTCASRRCAGTVLGVGCQAMRDRDA
jgi:hypothetical protein